MLRFKKKINQKNSSMAVQCISKEECDMRHTELCKSCKKNIGEKILKNCYERK